jgi:NADH-quinone oxidoreductase subunit C
VDKLDHLLIVLQEVLRGDAISVTLEKGEVTVTTYGGAISRVLMALRDHPRCLFKLLVDICGVDYPRDPKRFRVVYHLLSLELNLRVRVKIAAIETMVIPSVVGIFNVANWYEREIFDLYGIYFSDHPDLRRLLTDYDFEGHPLRKDFPLSGYEEVGYDESQRKVVYKPVSLPQEFRDFDYLSPWEGGLPSSWSERAKGKEGAS